MTQGRGRGAGDGMGPGESTCRAAPPTPWGVCSGGSEVRGNRSPHGHVPGLPDTRLPGAQEGLATCQLSVERARWGPQGRGPWVLSGRMERREGPRTWGQLERRPSPRTLPPCLLPPPRCSPRVQGAPRLALRGRGVSGVGLCAWVVSGARLCGVSLCCFPGVCAVCLMLVCVSPVGLVYAVRVSECASACVVCGARLRGRGVCACG